MDEIPVAMRNMKTNYPAAASDRLHVVVGEAEMVADFVDEHVGDEDGRGFPRAPPNNPEDVALGPEPKSGADLAEA